MRIGRGLALAVVALLVAGACSGDDTTQAADSTDTDSDVVAVADTASDDAPPEEEAEKEETAADEEDETDSDDSTAELPLAGTVGPGVYTTDLIGTPVTFDLDRDWEVQSTSPGVFVMKDPERSSSEVEVVLVMRVDSFAGPDEADALPGNPSYTGDPNDIDAWVDATGGGVIVEASDNRTISNASAEVRDLKLDESGSGGLTEICGPGPDERCFFVAATRTETVPFFIVRTGEYYRMWLIDQGDEEPILVSAHAEADDPGWLDDRAEALVAGLTLGDPAPHPVAPIEGNAWEAGQLSTVPAGEATFPAMGGVSMTLPEELFVNQADSCLGIEANAPDDDSPSYPPTVWVGRSDSYGLEAGSLTSVEDVLDLYEPAERPQPTGESLTALGEELAGYRVTGVGDPLFENMIACGGNFTLRFGPEAEVFLAETDEGVLFLAAEAATEEEMVDARALLDQIAPTLAFSN